MTYSPKQLQPNVDLLYIWRNKTEFEKTEDRSPMWVLFALEGGSFRFEIGEHKGIAGKGDLVLCPPETAFKREILSPAYFLAMYFTWHTGDGEAIADASMLQPNPAGKSTIRDKLRFASTCNYLKILNRRRDPSSLARKGFLLWDLWQLHAWEWETAKREAGREQANDPLMVRAEAIIRERAHGPFILKELSSEFGLSSVQFSRRFMAFFGVNPSDYVSELRLDRARTLLLETRLTIEEIAVRCGYSNGFYFSRVFSRNMRISPSEFRRAHRL